MNQQSDLSICVGYPKEHMLTFIEFCAMDFDKIFKIAHGKIHKKTVPGAATPTSVDQSF